MRGLRYGTLLVIVGLGSALGGFLAQAVLPRHRMAHAQAGAGQKTITAHQVTIIDQEGKEVLWLGEEGLRMSRGGARATLGIVTAGDGSVAPGLGLQNEHGRVAANVSAAGVAHLTVQHQRGLRVACLAAEDTAAVIVSENDGRGKAQLSRGGGVSSLVVEGSDDLGRATLQRHDSGGGVLEITDAEGLLRAQIAVLQDGEPRLGLLDEEQITYWSAP